MTTKKENIFIKSYGCQMNVYDSTRMSDSLSNEGYNETSEMDDAEVIILNTCHIREKAAEKIYSELGRIRGLKEKRSKEGKETTVIVAGCVAQAEGQEIIKRAAIVDMVVGPQSLHRLPELMKKRKSGKKIVDTDFPEEDKFDIFAKGKKKLTSSAFLTVQEGCDKFCTFCVVPYTRGGEYSRSITDLMVEAEDLVSRGVRELNLLGQNVNAYHGQGPDGKDWPLEKLLEKLAEIPDLKRLRYTTSHPREMSDALIALYASEPKVMPYLHLPFQAGSDRILKAMNRKHNGAFYRDIIAKVRETCPDIALSTDIIVGFPGETDEDFEDTLTMVRDLTFSTAYSFSYSPRPGTPASEIVEQVPKKVQSERLQILQALLNQQQADFNKKTEGKTLSVLFDRVGHKEGQILGKTPYLQSVHVQGTESLIGTVKEVNITSGGPNSLEGVLV